MSNQQWWYEQGGQPKGPLGSDEIRSMVETGVLVRSSRIILVGASDWGTIEEHAGELGLHSSAAGPSAATGPGPGPGPGTAPPPPMSSAPPPPQGAAPATVAYSAPAYSQRPADAPPIVTNGRRFGAYLMESLLFLVTLGIGYIIWMFVILGKGQTPGKQVLGVRVVDENSGKVVTYGTMALRVLVYQGLLGSVTFGITTIIGAVQILIDEERRQALWDKMAHTIVVHDPEGKAL